MDKKAKKKYYCKNTNIKAQRKDDLMGIVKIIKSLSGYYT